MALSRDEQLRQMSLTMQRNSSAEVQKQKALAIQKEKEAQKARDAQIRQMVLDQQRKAWTEEQRRIALEAEQRRVAEKAAAQKAEDNDIRNAYRDVFGKEITEEWLATQRPNKLGREGFTKAYQEWEDADIRSAYKDVFGQEIANDLLSAQRANNLDKAGFSNSFQQKEDADIRAAYKDVFGQEITDDWLATQRPSNLGKDGFTQAYQEWEDADIRAAYKDVYGRDITDDVLSAERGVNYSKDEFTKAYQSSKTEADKVAADKTTTEQPAQPKGKYRIEEFTTGLGGDAGGYGTGYALVDPDGNAVADVRASTNDYGSITGYYIDNSSGGESDGMVSQTSIDLDAINARAEKGNVPFGTGMGPALGYEYGMNNSSGNLFRKFDAQGNLTEYLDQDENWQKASDFKPTGLQFNSITGNLETTYSSPNSKRVNITESNATSVNRYAPTTGGFIDWGRMGALIAVGLTAGVAAGAFAGVGVAATAGSAGGLTAAQASALMGVANGFSTAGTITAAVQGALASIAVSGMQGASPADMLKSGLTGAVSAGIGSALSTAGFSSFQQAATKIAAQTGITAISGGDVEKALVNSIISSALPMVINNALPQGTVDALNSMPESARKVLMSTLSSSVMAGVQGQDISDAAIRGVTKGLTSVATDFVKGTFKDFTESDFAKSFSNTFGSSYEEFQELPPGVFEQEDDLATILAKDAQEVIDRNKPTGTTTTPATDTATIPTVTPGADASIVDQFNTNPSAEAFPVAPPRDFDLPPLTPGFDLIDGGIADEQAKGIFERYRSEWTKVASDANTMANLVGGTLSSGLGLVKSLNAETENFIKSLMTGEEFNKLTQAQQDKIYADSAAVFEKINDLVFKTVGIDASSDEAKSGVLTQAIEKAGEIIKPYIQSISDATGLNTQYIEAGLSVIVPSVLGKTVNTIGKVADDIKAGGWKDAFENTIDFARDKGLIPNDRFNFIGEGNVLYKVDADTPALSSSKLDQFNAGKLADNDPVFKIAESYNVAPRVAATMIDNSTKLGVPIGTAITLGLIDNAGNISPAGDTFLNPPPNLGEPQQDPYTEPAPDLEPAPDVVPVIRPEQPANDPVVDPADPANDPIFDPVTPETPVTPTPDGEPDKPIVPILPPVAPIVPDTGSPELDEILQPTPEPTPEVIPETGIPELDEILQPVPTPTPTPEPLPETGIPELDEILQPTPTPTPTSTPTPETPPVVISQPEGSPITTPEVVPTPTPELDTKPLPDTQPVPNPDLNPLPDADVVPDADVIPTPVPDADVIPTPTSDADVDTEPPPGTTAPVTKTPGTKTPSGGLELLNLMNEMKKTEAKTPEGAKIDYLYDIGDESIFATPKQESLFLSPFEDAPEQVEGVAPRYQYYDYNKNKYNYYQGGLIGDDDLQTIDDLYEMLRSK